MAEWLLENTLEASASLSELILAITAEARQASPHQKRVKKIIDNWVSFAIFIITFSEQHHNAPRGGAIEKKLATLTRMKGGTPIANFR